MIKSRIAPTPSGYLHKGNAFNFLLTNAMVRKHGGQLLLRIDDMDSNRSRPAYLAHIFSTLKALNIVPDEGPQSIADLQRQWSQKNRLQAYQMTLDKLVATGLVYACDCSRKQVAKDSINGIYSGRCRNRQLPLSKADAAWRIDCRAAKKVEWAEGGKQYSIALSEAMGDFVIRKKDGMPAYQVCSLTDDINFEINLIVRGQDLLESSAAQLWLAERIGAQEWKQSLTLLHHPLLLDDAGEKLSKSAGAAAIAAGGSELSETVLEYLNKKVTEYINP